jgi:hypothetical protein
VVHEARRSLQMHDQAADIALASYSLLHMVTDHRHHCATHNSMPSHATTTSAVTVPRHVERGSRRRPGLGKSIALDIARGLAFLHTHRIVHLVSSCAAQQQQNACSTYA